MHAALSHFIVYDEIPWIWSEEVGYHLANFRDFLCELGDDPEVALSRFAEKRPYYCRIKEQPPSENVPIYVDRWFEKYPTYYRFNRPRWTDIPIYVIRHAKTISLDIETPIRNDLGQFPRLWFLEPTLSSFMYVISGTVWFIMDSGSVDNVTLGDYFESR